MSKLRATTLTAVCAAALGLGAFVACGGPRSHETAQETDGPLPSPAPAPVLSTPAERPTGGGAGGHAGAVVGADAQPPPSVKELSAMVNELALMMRLHQLGETDPPLSLRLAREGNAQFPHTPDAPERALIVVKSLVDLGRFKEAQGEARRMLTDYPNDPHTREVEPHLLTE